MDRVTPVFNFGGVVDAPVWLAAEALTAVSAREHATSADALVRTNFFTVAPPYFVCTANRQTVTGMAWYLALAPPYSSFTHRPQYSVLDPRA